jgi:flagellin
VPITFSTTNSLTAQRHLGLTTAALRQSYERLSSGLRINHASDDPAGLALATALKTDGRVLAVAVRNINEGVSALSIAESALSDLSSITIRIQELAQQSANDTLSDTDRIALDDEAQALSDEFARIVSAAEYNDLGLLEGDFNHTIQAGFDSTDAIPISIEAIEGEQVGDGTYQTYATLGAGGTGGTGPGVLGDIDGDGILDLIVANYSTTTLSFLKGNGDGTFAAPITNTAILNNQSLNIVDLNNDGKRDVVTVAETGEVSVYIGNGTYQLHSVISGS